MLDLGILIVLLINWNSPNGPSIDSILLFLKRDWIPFYRLLGYVFLEFIEGGGIEVVLAFCF